MLIWTVLDDRDVFANFASTATDYLEIEREGIHLVVARQANGTASVVRLISPRPADYLRPEWQPGASVALGANDYL